MERSANQSQHTSYFVRRGFFKISVFEPDWGERCCNNAKYVSKMCSSMKT